MSQQKSLFELVDHQIKFWEERHGVKPVENPWDEGPWITISRQVGAGGTQLAYNIGKQLGWRVFDRYYHDELSVSEESTLKAFSELDERRYAGDALVFGMLDEPTQFVYIHKLMRIIRETARAGRAVIVGRGANCFLNPSAGLRLRVIAPVPKRIKRLIEHEGLRPEKAAECVKKTDDERRAFVRRVFNRDIDDASGYDLVINSDLLSSSMMIDIALQSLREKLRAVPAFEKVLSEV
ncbi:MAG: cytidylate kinase-like family protein [Candidatus Hydrogenedentota bacterium]